MNHLLFDRSLGLCPPTTFKQAAQRERTFSLSLSTHPRILSRHGCGIACLSIEHVRGRYLLSGGANGSLSLYDLFPSPQPLSSSSSSSSSPHIIKPTGHIAKRRTDRVGGRAVGLEEGHTSGISGVVWYPSSDLSAFLSSSYDGTVKVWDTSSLSPVFTFSLHSPISSLSLPSSATHTLASVGCEDDCVRLCDLSTGLCVQSLVGHQTPITVTQWAPHNQHHLVSGDRNGCLFLWDIRRSDAVLVSFSPGSSSAKSSIAPTPSYLHYQHEQDGLNNTNNTNIKSRGGGRGDGGRRRKVVKAHEGAVTGLVFSREGRRVISHGVDNKLRVWETKSGKMEVGLSRRFETSEASSRCSQMCLCGDGSVLALPDGDTVKVVDVLGDGVAAWGEDQQQLLVDDDVPGGGVVLKTLCGHLETVNGVVCHPFSSDLYSCGNDQQLLVWSGSGSGSGSLVGGVMGKKEKQENRNTIEKEDEDDWSDNYSSDSEAGGKANKQAASEGGQPH